MDSKEIKFVCKSIFFLPKWGGMLTLIFLLKSKYHKNKRLDLQTNIDLKHVTP